MLGFPHQQSQPKLSLHVGEKPPLPPAEEVVVSDHESSQYDARNVSDCVM
jgi:hypothetical protein